MRIGSLCTGYGGLDMAAEAVTGGTVAWVSDTDKGASTLLAHRYPDVPNLGDFTGVDWATVEPVDVLTAGFPCQPVSVAGKQLGDADERWLWDDVHTAVRNLGPRLIILENVRGLLTASGGRLFGRVVGTLADIGYDATWCGVRAADVGAPHRRWRVFIVATDTRSDGLQRLGATHDTNGDRSRRHVAYRRGSLLPTPRTSDTNGAGSHGDGGPDLRTAVTLLPTPTANDYKGSTAGRRKEGADRSQLDAVIEGRATRLLPTARWGDYAEVIRRWETIIGRPSPEPTQPSRTGKPQLAPPFVEWMMGLPEGWVTDVPGLTRNQQLKLCGNGVVPQQATAAIRTLL